MEYYKKIEFKEEDVKILDCFKAVSSLISAMYLPYDKKEFEQEISKVVESLQKMSTSYELWLVSKTDAEILQFYELDTTQNFVKQVARFLDEYKIQFSGMNIDKGHYLVEDSLYMETREWLYRFVQRYEPALEGLNILLEDSLQEMKQTYRADEKKAPEPQQLTPPKELEPQQGEQGARQRQHKQLGRKRKALKELIVPTDKETIYNRLQQQMEGASDAVAMDILINSIRNKILLKPSYGTFREAFPTITIPESTYYDKLKKAGIR